MMRRRIGLLLTLTCGLLLAPLAVEAQGPPGHIGVLGPAEEPRFSEVVAGLQHGLRAPESGTHALQTWPRPPGSSALLILLAKSFKH